MNTASTSLPPDCLSLLQAMIAFDSVNSRISQRPAAERPLADYLATLAKGWGLDVQFLPIDGEQANLLVSSGNLGGNEPVLLLESHLDTVTVEGMTIPPFTAVVADGRLSGRGSCDTKASGACMLWTLAQAHRDGTLANPTALLFTVDEEVGKLGIETFAKQQLPALGWKPALAVVGEPTLFAPIVAHNGAVRWKIRTRGIPAHSSDPSRGRSAISDMVHVIQELENNYIPSLSITHPLTGKAQASINQIVGGRQANVIPDCCEIVIDRRTVPGESLVDVLPTVETHLDKLRSQIPGIQVDQYDAFFDPSLEPAETEKTLEFLKPSLLAVGANMEVKGLACGTDAANLSLVGIPAVVIGPGDLSQAHTVDEWIALEQIHLGEKFFNLLVRTPLAG